MTTKLSGQCLCGAIAYHITTEIKSIVHCHCLQCRRWHGAAFRSRAAIPSKDFSWTQGEHHLSQYCSSDNVIKTFCSICGSNLISILKDQPDMIGLPIAAIEQNIQPQSVMHIFVDSKASWYEIQDNAPQHQEWPPGGADAVRNQHNQTPDT